MAKQTGTDKSGKRVFDYSKQDAPTKRKMEQERLVREGKKPVESRKPTKVVNGVVTGGRDYDYSKQPKAIQKQMEQERVASSRPKNASSMQKIASGGTDKGMKSPPKAAPQPNNNGMKSPPRGNSVPSSSKTFKPGMPKQNPMLSGSNTTTAEEPRSVARATSTPGEQAKGETNKQQAMADANTSLTVASMLPMAGPLARGIAEGAGAVGGFARKKAMELATRGAMEAEAGAAARGAGRLRGAGVQIERSGAQAVGPKPTVKPKVSGNAKVAQSARPKPMEPGGAAGRSMGKPAGKDVGVTRPERLEGSRATRTGPMTKKGATRPADPVGYVTTNKAGARKVADIKARSAKVTDAATPKPAPKVKGKKK